MLHSCLSSEHKDIFDEIYELSVPPLTANRLLKNNKQI